jgi:hypothetical protein
VKKQSIEIEKERMNEMKIYESHHLKIMIIQMYNSSPQRCVELMTKYLENEQDNKKIDFILLPEGAISYLGDIETNSIPSELQCLSNFALNNHLILICGTITETVSLGNEMKCYTTCLVFDQDGHIILKYRKRDTMGMMNDGTDVGICETIYGTIGVLICYDIERPHLLEDTLALSPSLIFNPAHLSSFHGLPQSLIHSSWKIALDTSSRYFEYLSSSTGVTFIRCDQPDSANTFLTTPTQTIFIPSLNEQSLSVLVPYPQLSCPIFASPGHQLRLSSEFGRIRTEKMDNTGLRVTIQTIPRTRPKRVKRLCQNILKIQIFVPKGRPKGRIVIFSKDCLEIWDPVDFSLFYFYDLPANLCSCSNESNAQFVDFVIDDDGIIEAIDSSQHYYKWIPISQSYEVSVTSDDQLSVLNHREESVESPTQTHSQFFISDTQQREWMVSLEHQSDLQCPHLPEHYHNPSHCCSTVGFHSLPLMIHDLTSLPLPLYRILLPVSCHYNFQPQGDTKANLHYDKRVAYFLVVTDERIHLLQIFHNRVSVKLIDFFSAIETTGADRKDNEV